jgi:predicted RNA methylase
MKTVNVPISPETREILRSCTFEPKIVRLPNITLDRDQYLAINKVFAALGGKWNTSKKAHVFKTDQTFTLRALAANDNGTLVDRKKTYQAFFTPDPVADQLVATADLFPGVHILEPSAGDGALIRAARRVQPDIRVTAVEFNPDHFSALVVWSNTVHTRDFMTMTPAINGQFDCVLMNPPFSGGRGVACDVEHVMHAFTFVRPGGRLSAIISPAFRFRREKVFVQFREMHVRAGAREIEIPAGAFRESGTNIATVIVTWEKA